MDIIKEIQNIFNQNYNRDFLIDYRSGSQFTFGYFFEKSLGIQEFLSKQGIIKGDRIAVISDNTRTTIELYFSCLISGIIIVPINPMLTPDQMNEIIINSKSKAVFINAEVLSGRYSVPGTSNLKYYLYGENHENTIYNKSNLIQVDFSTFRFERSEILLNIDENDDFLLVYTSGTTSTPKGIIHTYKNMFSNALIFNDILGIGPNNRFINFLPLSFLGGYYNLLMLPFISGASVVLVNSFGANSIANFWKPIIDYKVNTIWLVPTILSFLIEMDRGEEGVKYCNKNNILFLIGTAPLRKDKKELFEKKYNRKIFENYGLSETLFISTQSPKYSNSFDSVGRLLPGVVTKIVDRNLAEVNQMQEGEIIVKTPTFMKGYYNSSTQEIEKISNDNWFSTGDLGQKNSEDELFITDRKKDLIIRGGINISPAVIEDVIMSIAEVQECAVVGMPHAYMGEEIIAVIKSDAANDFNKLKSRINSLCKTKLSIVQQPNQIIELNEFPHTVTGKVKKEKIKNWISKEYGHLFEEGNKGLYKVRGVIDHSKFYQASRVVQESIQATSIRFNTMVYEMKRKGIDVIVLSLGEAFFDIPLYPMDDLPFPTIYHYSHSRGIPELREAIAKYFSEEYDFVFDPEKEIIITAGSKIAIHMTLMSILNPGDEAIIHEPAWVSYPEQIKLCYGVPVRIPYYESIFNFEKYITNRTKVIIINSPNNPSGKVFTLEELSYLYKLAEKYNLYILSDEAYSDFLLKEDNFVSIGNMDIDKKHLIVVNSISKNYGISGWRLGYVITNEYLINQILKVNQHLITCPATILEYYIAKYFFKIIEITKPQILEVVQKRQKIAKYMEDIGLEYLPGTATFYFFVSIKESNLTSEQFCIRLLEESKICAVPGIGYGDSCDDFIRVSVGSESMERTLIGINAIKELIQKTSN